MGPQTLLIDDDPVFSGYMVGLLEAAGLDIACVGDARATLVKEDISKYTRILCDLNMPDMDGIEFIEHLSKISWQGELIIVSGEAQNVIRAASRLANFLGLKIAGTLSTPVKLTDILHILNRNSSAVSKTAPPNILTERKSYIDQAIRDLAVTPVYQPQLNLGTMKIDGFEALMRLELQDGSLASPNEFFDIITPDEEEELTIKQSKKILKDFKIWSQTKSMKRCSINLSPRLLAKNSVVESLVEDCRRFGITPSQIIIEVTENEPLIDTPNLISAMSRLRIAGFGLALDDFGSGHANIQELGWFPFSEIKTDLIFGRDMLQDRFARAAVEFAVRAAEQLELELTVEGLEQAEAVSLAAKLGANHGQGYAIARPVSSVYAEKLALAS